MMEVCGYVMQLIGPDLTALGASDFRQLKLETEQVCLFSIGQRRIAVPYSPREGIACYVSLPGDSDDRNFRNWDTLWHVAGLPEAENFEQLDQIIDRFPENTDEAVRLIGGTLREKFGS